MSSPQTIIVDDTNSDISYSGSWSVVRNSDAYSGSLHQTSTSGSSYTLSYVGSPVVTFFGAIEPCDSHHGNPAYEITMDGVTGSPMTIVCDREFQNGLSVSAQGDGPPGVNSRHVVTLTNLGGAQDLPLMLDYIQYVSYAGESPSTPPIQTTPSSTSQVEGPVTASPAAASGPSTTANAAPTSSTNFESTRLPVSSQASTGSSTESEISQTLPASTVVHLTTINGIATSFTVVTTPTSIAAPNITGSNSSSAIGTGSSSSHSMIGPIIGGIIGAIFVTLFLVLLYSRRRKVMNTLKTLIKRSPGSVSPFVLAPTNSSEEAGLSTRRHSMAQVSSSSVARSDCEQQAGDSTVILDDEKRASGPLASRPWPSVSEAEARIPTPEPEISPPPLTLSSSLAHQLSRPLSPSSSIAHSYTTVPAYVGNPTDNISRVLYRSGISAFSNSDVPPSYDSIGRVEMSPQIH